jgi:hypothetical protein
MKASRLALMCATILSIASIAQGISAVLVTDDAGMRALAESDERGLIRGTVSSVDSKQYGGGPLVVYLHFAGVKNDHVFAAITDPTPWQDLYRHDLSGLVGKMVEIMSKAAEKDSGQIYFGTSYYPDFRVIEAGVGSPKIASPAHSGKSHGDDIDAGMIVKLETLGNDGNMLAQEELGAIYFGGYGTIERDYKKSVFWFEKAVDQNKSVMGNTFLARMYENGWGVEQDSVLASGYYQNIALSPGNLPLKKAIEPEWIEVHREKKVLSRFDNHVEYADAESRMHPGRHSYSDPDAAYMKAIISAAAIAALTQGDPKSQLCVNGPRLQARRVFNSSSGQWLTPVTWECR